MRSITHVQHNKQCLYKLRVAQGIYLSDVSVDNLCHDEQMALYKEAKQLHYKTQLTLRRVKRNGRWVWRFMNRNGL